MANDTHSIDLDRLQEEIIKMKDADKTMEVIRRAKKAGIWRSKGEKPRDIKYLAEDMSKLFQIFIEVYDESYKDKTEREKCKSLRKIRT